MNALAPRKRPLHTLAPAMATDRGVPVAVFGAMGAHAQAQLHLQMLDALLLDGLDPASVTARPRWFVEPNAAEFRLLVESRAPWSGDLRARGHEVVDAAAFDQRMGHEQIVLIDHDRGALVAASDPRTDGLLSATDVPRHGRQDALRRDAGRPAYRCRRGCRSRRTRPW